MRGIPAASEGDKAFDPYEMDAEPEETAFGAGSYIDLLPRDGAWFCQLRTQERWMRAVIERLRVYPGAGGSGGACTCGRRRSKPCRVLG